MIPLTAAQVCRISLEYASKFLPPEYVLLRLTWVPPRRRASEQCETKFGCWSVNFACLDDIIEANGHPEDRVRLRINAVSGEVRELQTL